MQRWKSLFQKLRIEMFTVLSNQTLPHFPYHMVKKHDLHGFRYIMTSLSKMISAKSTNGLREITAMSLIFRVTGCG